MRKENDIVVLSWDLMIVDPARIPSRSSSKKYCAFGESGAVRCTLQDLQSRCHFRKPSANLWKIPITEDRLGLYSLQMNLFFGSSLQFIHQCQLVTIKSKQEHLQLLRK